jgi:hypothetical protein
MSTSKVNINNQSAKKNIRFEHELIEAIEDHKDPLIPFSAWVKQACKEKLERESGGVVTSAPLNSSNKTLLNHTASDLPLNAKTNRDEIQLIAMDLKGKGNTCKQIAEYFNSLGYLTGTMKEFKPDSVTSLLRYTDNLKNKDIKL